MLPGAPRRRCFFLRGLKLLPGLPAGVQARQRKLGICVDVTPRKQRGHRFLMLIDRNFFHKFYLSCLMLQQH